MAKVNHIASGLCPRRIYRTGPPFMRRRDNARGSISSSRNGLNMANQVPTRNATMLKTTSHFDRVVRSLCKCWMPLLKSCAPSSVGAARDAHHGSGYSVCADPCECASLKSGGGVRGVGCRPIRQSISGDAGGRATGTLRPPTATEYDLSGAIALIKQNEGRTHQRCIRPSVSLLPHPPLAMLSCSGRGWGFNCRRGCANFTYPNVGTWPLRPPGNRQDVG